MPRLLLIALIVAAALAVILFVPFSSPSGNAYSLSRIDVADSEEEWETGLTGKEVPPDYGMLFIFDTEGSYGFWMKGTLAPLDVIWLSRDGVIVGIEHSLAPDTYPQSYYPPSPVRYVLETLGGTAKERGWEKGTKLSLPLR